MKCRCYDCVRGLDRRQEIRHGGAVEEELPYKRLGKKNTKRWCKGKVGREHYIVKTIWHEHWTVYACDKCGKIFWDIGFTWNR